METMGGLPSRLISFVNNGLSKGSSRVLVETLTMHNPELPFMKSQLDCPVLRCEIESMIAFVQDVMKQKNNSGEVKHTTALKNVVEEELTKWLTPKRQLNPHGKLTQSLYRQEVHSTPTFRLLRCSPAAEYHTDGVLRLKSQDKLHDPLSVKDVYCNELLSFGEFWPLPKNHSGVGGFFLAST